MILSLRWLQHLFIEMATKWPAEKIATPDKVGEREIYNMSCYIFCAISIVAIFSFAGWSKEQRKWQRNHASKVNQKYEVFQYDTFQLFSKLDLFWTHFKISPD